MVTQTAPISQERDTTTLPQFNLATSLLMFAWPAAWYTLLIYGLVRLFVPPGEVVPTWLFLLIIVLGGGAEGVAGLMLLRREGYPLTRAALQRRIRWQWPADWMRWSVVLLVLALGMLLSMMAGPLNRALAEVSGFAPPPWWPAASNPLVEVNGAADVFPGINLQGNVGFVLLYTVIGLLFNVAGEEVYYRGYLLPRMRGVFGRWDWVANGIGFTLKHIYQRWMYPGILVGGLTFAFAAGPLGSLPLAIVYHWIGNFLFPLIFLILAALGVG